MRNTYTPGPWISSGKYPESDESLFVATIARKDRPIICRIANTVSGRSLDDEEFANAQLIAAAPELLEACKKFVVAFSILDDGPDASDEAHAKDMLVEALKMARAAIAKTEDIAFRRFNPKTRSYE